MDINKIKAMKLLKTVFKNNIILLLKFTDKEEHAKDVLNGNLYMNTAQYYRDLEKLYKIKGLGDKNEVKQIFRFEELNLSTHDHELTGNKEILKFKEVKGDFYFEEDSTIPMYCMMGLTIDDFEIYEIDNNIAKLRINLKNINIDRMVKDFGQYVSIINYKGFKKRIIDRCKEDNFYCEYGAINYCEENNLEKINSFIEGSPKRFLYKDLFFEYQKEFRWIILGKDINESNFYNIGNLEGIVTNIMTIDINNVIFPRDLNLSDF